MTTRLTAEREARIRALVADDYVTGSRLARELLAELDAVRAERDVARAAAAGAFVAGVFVDEPDRSRLRAIGAREAERAPEELEKAR